MKIYSKNDSETKYLIFMLSSIIFIITSILVIIFIRDKYITNEFEAVRIEHDLYKNTFFTYHIDCYTCKKILRSDSFFDIRMVRIDDL